MSQEAVKVIGDILTVELGLPAGRIMLTNERYFIPQVNGLYIALSYLGGKAIANNNRTTPTDAGMAEVQEVVMLYEIQIDIMSFDNSARLKKEQIYQALRSIYAEKEMAENTMQIARMPKAFVDSSSLEESKMLNRYTMTISVSALLSLTKEVPYYGQFDREIFANN